MTYQLPAGISCDGGCVLQWRYFAMQSCVEKGCDRTYCGAYADGTNAVYGGRPGFCGDPGVAAAEFFLNCAGMDCKMLYSPWTFACLNKLMTCVL
jgi:hypothetical protein